MPISFLGGRIILSANDLSANGFGSSWGHTRSYNNRLTDVADFGNGFNWLIAQWPYLVIQPDSVTVVRAGRNSLWFDADEGEYVGRFGIQSSLTYDSGSDEFTVTAPSGTTQVFSGFDAEWPGQLLRQVTPGDSTISLTYSGSRVMEMVRSVEIEGELVTEAYAYEYFGEGDNADQIASVSLKRRVAGGPWFNIRRAQYSYYIWGESEGLLNDLKTVHRELSEDGLTWQSLGTTYYRYYLDDAGGRGFAHGLKFVVNPQSFFAISQAFGNPLTAMDEQITQYADNYFEFDDLRRVTREVTNGGTRTFAYQYFESDFSDGANNWKYKTVESRDDGSQRIVYMNYVGTAMLDELTDGTSRWITYQLMDEDTYQVLQIAEPSAINLSASPVYDPTVADLAVQLKESDGLLRLYEYFDGTDGGPANYLKRYSVQKGTGGDPVKQKEFSYDSQSVGVSTVYPIAAQTNYRNDDGTGTISTTFDYEYYEDTLQVLQKTTNFPVVLTDQNGSGLPTARREQYDEFGNRVWEQGPMGYIDHFSYDVVTGALIQHIEDVDPAKLTLPDGWTRPATLAPALHLITDYEADQFGRTTQELGPAHEVDGVGVRTARWTVYRDAGRETLSAQGFVSGPDLASNAVIVNPVSIARTNLAKQQTDAIRAIRALTADRLSVGDCFSQSLWVAWTQSVYDDAGRQTARRIYSCVPTCGAGVPETNYDETIYGYDVMGRRNRTVTPGGTINRTVYDARDRVVSSWVGSDDYGATDDDPTGCGAPGNNMVPISSRTYALGCECGEPATLTNYVDADSANDRVTTFTYDFRDRLTIVDGEIDYYEERFYDNLDNVIKVERRDTSSSGNLIARNETFFDDQGRVYRTKRYAVDPSTGTVGNALTGDTWYDAAGKPIKQVEQGAKEGRAFTKRFFDSMGRTYATYVGYYTGEQPEPYDQVGEISDEDNMVFEQTLLTYDDAGNLLETVFYRRFNSATGYGVLNPPTGSQPLARVSYVANWYDGVGRIAATAKYGTNDNVALARPDVAPERSDDVLVTAYNYDDAGNRNRTTDPAGRVAVQTFNAVRRVLSSISNYVPAALPDGTCNQVCSPGCGTKVSTQTACPGDAENVTVRMTYNADGNLATLIACNPTTGDQVTRYEYGVTLDDSALASNLLLRSTVYPDATDGNDRVVLSYNRQSQVAQMTDQNGTVHEYAYDKLGRKTADRVTTLGSGINGAVRRLETSYDVRGLTERATSYDAATDGSVVNEVTYLYNDFAQLISERQSHSGEVVP